MSLVTYLSSIDFKELFLKLCIRDDQFCLPCLVQIFSWIVVCLLTLYTVFFNCTKFVTNIVKILYSQFYTSGFRVMIYLEKYSALIILCDFSFRI